MVQIGIYLGLVLVGSTWKVSIGHTHHLFLLGYLAMRTKEKVSLRLDRGSIVLSRFRNP
jgi:hypothetical protein